MFALDAYLSRQLKRFIRKEGGSAESIKVSRGAVHLRDVSFSCEALTEMLCHEMGVHTPVSLESVHCRSVDVVIPLSQWRTRHLEVNIEGLSVVARRCDYSTVSCEQLRELKEERIQKAMRALLLERVLGASEPTAEESAPRKQSLADVVLRKVLGRIRPKVSISRVHLRYEGLHTEALAPCAVGVVVGSLNLRLAEDSKKLSDVGSFDLTVANSGMCARCLHLSPVVPSAASHPVR